MKCKIIKGIVTVGVLTIMIVPCFTYKNEVDAVSTANTLGELKKELQDYKDKKSKALSDKKKTQSEINASKNAISVAQTEINTNRRKIEEAKIAIEKLNVEIKETEEKIKDVLVAHEVTSGDNNYLEYIFGASSISDFIIRYSMSEQLASYNDDLITSYEGKIEENEQLQIDLANREKDLDKKILDLEKAIDSLGNQVDAFDEQAIKFEAEVKSTQELIDFYVSQGCKDNEQLSTCVKVVSDTGFARPLKKGVRTSNYGYRWHPTQGVWKLHNGVDIGGNAEGTPVYSIANGMVGKVLKRQSCGGNMVYIYHTVNGVKYTSTYMHLLNINVKVGDMVTSETKIGSVGGTTTSTSHGGYDSCTTGAHLHLSLAKGWYGKDYQSYSTWISKLLDAGLSNYVNIPPYGKYFYSRVW